MLLVHCVAHRHALASADAAQDNVVAAFFESSLHDILNYHCNSPQRCGHLRTLQERLKVPLLRMVRVVVTRWLSRAAATLRIFSVIAALVVEFREDAADPSNTTAKALHKLTMMHDFLCALVLFNDILFTLAQISTALQKPRVTFGEVAKLVAGAKEYFKCSFGTPFYGGANYVKMKTARENTYLYAQGTTQLYFDFNGIKRIAVDEERELWVINGVQEYAASLVTALDLRFPSDDTCVLANFYVFDLHAFPVDMSADFGDKAMEGLLQYYGKPKGDKGRVVDPALARAQWPLLRALMKDAAAKLRAGDISEDAAYSEVRLFPKRKVSGWLFLRSMNKKHE
jgi:hypothetical protein